MGERITQEELHDLERTSAPVLSRGDLIWIARSIIAGTFIAMAILAIGDASARSDRPTACADLTAAECGVRMAEAAQ